MGLTSSLAIGRSALNASQVAIQITGNNFANASTPGYSRQIVSFIPGGDQRVGDYFLGRGVNVGGVRRSADQALQSRLWNGYSQEAATNVGQQFLTGMESVINELGDSSLSNGLTQFFNSWSELANSPNRDGARALVVQQGLSLAGQIKSLRSDLVNSKTQLDQQTGSVVSQADTLLSQIAQLNVSIVSSEGGAGQDNSLRDQRDQLVTQLSQLMDVTVVEQPNGTYNVLVGSVPVVIAGESRGLKLDQTASGNGTDISVRVKANGTKLDITGGQLGGLLAQRYGQLDKTISRLDSVASQLIFQVNRIHSAGFGGTPLSEVTGTQTVPAADTTRALNDPANATFAGLPYKAVNGGFLVTVKNNQTGATQTVRINVDLDGITNAGTPGTADDTSVSSLAGDLNGVSNLTATVNPDGTLKIAAATGFSVSFSEDSSGVLAVLGINTYFTGTNGANIGVRQDLQDSPGLLAAGQTVGGQSSDNGAALAIAALANASNGALGGESIAGSWRDAAQEVGAASSAAATQAQAATIVRQNLDAQRSAVSGVSLDEESINLMNYQRQYQGAARFITVVDQMTQTLMGLIQ